MKKIVLITGASGGIGEALVRAFAQSGYGVAIHCSESIEKAQKLENELKENGGDAAVFRCDLSNDGAPKWLVDSVIGHFGRIDVLVNNAGVSLVSPFLDTDEKEGERLIKINLTAAIECSKYAAEDMLKRKSGSIINISSVWGICGASCEVYYSAAKAGIIGFTKALASELAPSNIRVNSVAPGVIDTKMNSCFSESDKKAIIDEIPMGRMGSGYDVANAALFLASNAADYITGQTLNVSGGFLI
ncbi:MAG: 3-oxoacyl-ACP reductase FabG [Oscillospiraceae bacterium]|nr:3-oxoacyl-ACP reductase FabG [Oscillospiraceae bacterium]